MVDRETDSETDDFKVCPRARVRKLAWPLFQGPRRKKRSCNDVKEEEANDTHVSDDFRSESSEAKVHSGNNPSISTEPGLPKHTFKEARDAKENLCPICQCDLQDISSTLIGRQAHVNACLEKTMAATPSEEKKLQQQRRSVPAASTSGRGPFFTSQNHLSLIRSCLKTKGTAS